LQEPHTDADLAFFTLITLHLSFSVHFSPGIRLDVQTIINLARYARKLRGLSKIPLAITHVHTHSSVMSMNGVTEKIKSL
jgi:hypothetical protein